MDRSHNLECKLLKTTWAQFIKIWSLARATKSMNFLLTYVPQLPFSQIVWIKIKSRAAYFPFNWETLQPSFYTTTLSGDIWMQRFTTFIDRIVSSFVILAWSKHNIFAITFLVMNTKIPCTTDFITFSFNWTTNQMSYGCQLEGHQIEKPNHT